MPDVIDLCSDGEDDLPVHNFPSKKQTQRSTLHNPPTPTNAKETTRCPPTKSSHPPVGYTNGPTFGIQNNSPLQNGAAASTSTRVPNLKVPTNGTKATQYSTQRLDSGGSSISRLNLDRPAAGSASQRPRSAVEKPVFRDRSIASSSQEGIQTSSSSGSLQERGQKRAHNFNAPGYNGSHPHNPPKQIRTSGLGGSTPSSKAFSSRPVQSSKATTTDKSRIIDLTLSDNEEPPAKKSRNNASRIGSSNSSSPSGGPSRPLALSKTLKHRSRPVTEALSSATPKSVPAVQPALDTSRRSPQHKASKGSAVTTLISASPRSVHTSVERSIDTHGQASAAPGTSSSKNKATTFGQKSCFGSSPTKSRESSQRPFVGRLSMRLGEVRERRSTIPESPPLSPILDDEVHKSPSNTARPHTNSRRASTRSKVIPQSSAVSGNDPGGLKSMTEDFPGHTLSNGLCIHRSDQPYGTEDDWNPNHARKSEDHIVSPGSRLRRLDKDLDASVDSTAAQEHGMQAAQASSIIHHDFEALLHADAHDQHTQVANATLTRSAQPERARSQDQQVGRSCDAPPTTVTSSDVTRNEHPPASVEQHTRPRFLLSLVNRNPKRSTSTKSPQLASSRDMSLASAQTTGFDAIERAVGQYVEEMRSDNEHWTKIELQRARMMGQIRGNVKKPGESTSVFTGMTPIPLRPLHKKSVPAGCAKLISELHPLTSKTQRNSYYAQYTTYDTSNTVQVPNYNHYVSISNNILANNVTSLQHWPYFGDDFDLNEALNLKKEYYIDVDDRERKLLRLAQAENFAPYAEDLIQSVNCEWSDILHFLLELEPDVGTNSDARKALRDRANFISEDFIRDGERWGKALEKLPTPLPDKAGRAAVLCDHFQRIAKFSFWHLVRRSAYTKRLVADAVEVQDESQLTCRVCMRLNCPYHGEIRDHPRGQGPADNQIVETDIILPQVVNYRTRVSFPTTVDSEPVDQEKRRTLEYWEKGPFGNLKWKADERGPFYPCNHPGISCSDARCSCFDARIACEKSCSCGPGCKRKWKGCSCHSGKRPKGKTVCWEDDRCACWQLSRECDPDLCSDCGVADVLDPVHRHDDRILQNRCRLASLQRGVAKHTIIGDSGVHGLGLYACEDIHCGDFVGEYKGETITKEEAERRGAVYEHQKLSYLFTLNQKQEIDSTYFGNKIRFINHVQESKSNLKPLITMVNTVFRIGMYAKQNIRAGEEFFFDYGPSFPRDQLDGNKQSKSAPRARVNTHNFHEVDLMHDQEGHVRATKKATGTGSGSSDENTLHRPGRPHGSLNKHRRSALSDTSSSGSKQHGGARLGAGRPRRALQPVDEAESGDVIAKQADEDQGSGNVAEASDVKRMDAEHRITMYNVHDGSAGDEDFELEEDSLSEVDVMSSAEE